MQFRSKLLLSAAGIAVAGSLAFAGAGLAGNAAKERPGFARHSAAHQQIAGHYGKRHGHGYRHHRGLAMLKDYDANGDDKLSQEEIDRGRAERLARFDENRDGSLSLAEFEALWLEAMRERMVDRFQSYDDDGDGLVTGDEYAEPFSRMVRRWDRNGDGMIGLDDRRSRRHHDSEDD